MYQTQSLQKKKILQKHLAAFNALGDASCCLGSKLFLSKALDDEVTLALEIYLLVFM